VTAEASPVVADRLLLAGLMGSGKSSVGRGVAARRGLHYVDNDAEIAVLAGEPTLELARRGGDVLHRWESAYVRHLDGLTGPLVAGLPGSTADRPYELAALRRTHTVVYLHCDVETLLARVAGDAPRPWLADIDARPFIEQTYARRDPVLRQAAHHVVDASAALPSVLAAVLQLT
jgi:shikimate kinase